MPNEYENKNEEKQEEQPVTQDMTEFTKVLLRDISDFIKNDFYNIEPRKYSRDEVRRFLKNPEKYPKQLREISRYMYISSSQYFRLINYFASMLTFDYIVVPLDIDQEKVKKDGFKNNYNKAVEFLEGYNIKHHFKQILKICLIEDVFFGYERKWGNSVMIQKLPANYCVINGIEDGVYTFSFDMRYFNGKNNSLLPHFPEEFQKLYKDYIENNRKSPWRELSTEKTLCFKFNEEFIETLPPFINIYEEIMDLEERREILKTGSKIDNFKLLTQKIPMKDKPQNEKDFILNKESVREFHNNIKKSLPYGVNVVSTPMELNSVSFDRASKNSLENQKTQAEKDIFDTAGVSSGLFSGSNNNQVSMDKGINVDESLVIPFYRQIERFFKNRLNYINSKNFRFKIWFPDITIYNRKDKHNEFLRDAQFGFPKSLVACSRGYSVKDLENLSVLENNYLGLGDNLEPLNSAHTSSNNYGGRPSNEDNNNDDGNDGDE